jgi:hypothetical protein
VQLDNKFCVIPLALACLLGGCASVSGTTRDSIVYFDVGRTYKTEITNSVYTSGAISVRRIPPFEKATPYPMDSTSEVVVDCSDRQFLCTRIGTDVFAVPRAGLGLAEYEAQGVHYRVEKCILGDKSGCAIALISATCESLSEVSLEGKQHCERSIQIPGTTGNVAYVIYFVFNEDVGVTAIGYSKSLQESETEQMAALSQSILISEHGILCCQLTSAGATRR